MWAKIVIIIYGLSMTIVFLESVQQTGALPSGTWRTGVDPGLFHKIEDMVRIEREIDLRQNLHKHLKPFVSISHPKKPKPVEKPITPYFVRILKRRPGTSSKESSEDEIPKVLIDKRRNKEKPLPVVIVDQHGIPLQNKTVENMKAKYFITEPTVLQQAENQGFRQLPKLSFQPIAEALKSETETQSIPTSSQTIPTVFSNPPAIFQTVAPPVPVVEISTTTSESPVANTFKIIELTPTTSTTEWTSTTPTTTEWTTPSTTEVTTTTTTPSTTQWTTSSSTTELTTPRTIELSTPSTTETTTPSTTEVTTPSTTEVTTPSTTEVTTPSTTEVTTPSTTESTTRSTTKLITASTTEITTPITTEETTELTTSSTTELAPSTTVEPSTESPISSLIAQDPPETFSPAIFLDNSVSEHFQHDLSSPTTVIPEIISTSSEPTTSDYPSIPHHSSYPDEQLSFESVSHLPSDSDYTSNTAAFSDSSPSFSTLAVTTLLPNGAKPSTVAQQDDQAIQASEIFPQRLPSTTPISLSNSKNPLELTTLKPAIKSPSNALSSEQLQLLMKAAITRYLLQGAGASGPATPNKLPEVTIPQQVRLVENKAKADDVVVFSPVSNPSTKQSVESTTNPMPSLISALQNLISATNPAPQRQNRTPQPVESQVVASNNNNNLFAPDGPFSRFFSTSRSATSNNFASVRASNGPTTAAPTFFINLRDQSTSQLPPRQPEVVTSRYPILPTPPAPTKTWQEFNGRQNNNNSNPLRAILMAPVNIMSGLFKAAQQLGAFMGNAFTSLTSVFNPNRNRVNY